ncbi:hypothetical protein J3R83DRAFT_511 [Lanmaoa asiatica]|nr:hypothetical protein J3R83DRAFT_511 [Lanmaoa asiatica]
MNSTNINDPTAVKALLDQLRASQAWQDTLNSSPSHIGPEQHAEVRESFASTSEDVQGESRAQSPVTAPPASVTSLLSQLRTSEWTSTAINTPPVSKTRTAHQLSRDIPRPSQEPPPTQLEHRTPRPIAATSSTRVQDIRSMSFQQALPHLTQLASDPGFIADVSRLRQEQNELEQQLWEERQAVHKKHEERVKVAHTKATLIGAGLSKHEADVRG